jgi:alpha-L-fucosidase
VQSGERIAPERYRRYLDYFNPDLYDPTAWAAAAHAAGMRYVVLAAKHHEGFCLWDSAHTEYKATRTPYGKDLLTPFVEAFRAAGLRVGFYYSLIDWSHPDFTIDRFHPLRDHPEAERLNQERDMAHYAQLTSEDAAHTTHSTLTIHRQLPQDYGSCAASAGPAWYAAPPGRRR